MSEILKKMGRKLLQKKQGGKEIIIELGLMVIGVFLIAAFRTEIGDLLSTIMSTTSTKILELFTI